MNPQYLETVRLLTQVAPLIFVDDTFALKGGTAINLFMRALPRLSVDLDLVFTNHMLDRTQALAQINLRLQEAAQRLNARGFQTYLPTAMSEAGETKLLVRRAGLEVKVEVNVVTRGTLHPVKVVSLTSHARDTLQADIRLPVVSQEDLYGGKLVAAFDRQHPRDLFDVMQLFANEGITAGIRRAFVIYLACHNRPVHEVLFPSLRDLQHDYERTFKGMTLQEVTLDELLSTRKHLLDTVPAALDNEERTFLISLVKGVPQWKLLGIDHLEQLPALRWKAKNLQQLAARQPKKFSQQAQALTERLESI